MTDQTSEGQRSKLAILGCAVTTLALAPFNDLSYEIWVHGAYPTGEDLTNFVPRWDVWFETHDPAKVPDNIKSHMEWCARQTGTIMVPNETPLLPNATVFGWQRLVDEWGSEPFTSTTAFMFAEAIYCGRYKEIGLFGVDMSGDEEWHYQRAGVKFFEAVAKKYHGIKVTIPPQSELSRERIPYPFALETPMGMFVADLDRKANEHIAILKGEVATYQAALDKCEGGKAIVDRLKRYHAYE